MTQTPKPPRERLSTVRSTFNPSIPTLATPLEIKPEVQPEPEQTEQMTPPTEEKVAAIKEQKANTVKTQKVKEVKEVEKATEKMSIYLTPMERAKYRKIMREIEAGTQKRLDENKFFRLILKHLDSKTLLMEETKG